MYSTILYCKSWLVTNNFNHRTFIESIVILKDSEVWSSKETWNDKDWRGDLWLRNSKVKGNVLLRRLTTIHWVKSTTIVDNDIMDEIIHSVFVSNQTCLVCWIVDKHKCRFSWCLVDMTTKSNTMDHFLLLRLMLLLIYCYTDYYIYVFYMLTSMHKRVYLLFVSSR